jgi:NADH-quinone oxidoreductase subunit J
MEFITILFYLFATLTIVACIAVISSSNPVYSVLWLIFAFFNSAALFILLKAEMLAMLLVVVYVGAVAVLFLFVVMMLNIKIASLKKGFQAYLPIGLIMALILAVELGAIIIHKNNIIPHKEFSSAIEEASKLATKDNKGERIKKTDTNAHKIGAVLYTENILFFQLCGLILFVAMIGAIVLTLRQRKGVRKQNITMQNNRNRETSISIVKVESGKGI